MKDEKIHLGVSNQLFQGSMVGTWQIVHSINIFSVILPRVLL